MLGSGLLYLGMTFVSAALASDLLALTAVGSGGVMVALAAGAAGTVAYESGASAAVGVIAVESVRFRRRISTRLTRREQSPSSGDATRRGAPEDHLVRPSSPVAPAASHRVGP